MVLPSGPLPALSPVFTDVLATRIADYTGRDRGEVLAIVRSAGDRLPDRAADLMLENLRTHLGDETPAERAATSLEEERVRAAGELIRGLDEETATRVVSLATRHGQLPPRPAAGELADVAAEAPVHADWAELELDLDDLAGRLDPGTAARVRDYVTGSGPPGEPTARGEYASVDRRLRAGLRQDLGSLGDSAEGPGLVSVHQARADAERVAARAVGLVQPVATGLGEPRAVALERAARIDLALGALTGQAANASLDRKTVDSWLNRADEVAAGIRRDPATRDGAVQDFGQTLVAELQEAAGDRQAFGVNTRVPNPDGVLRDGLAVRWAREQAVPELFARLPFPPELDGLANVSLPDRWEAQLAEGFVRTVAEQAGLPEGEVLNRLNSASAQRMDEAGRLLLPDERAATLTRFTDFDSGRLHHQVVDAMRWEFGTEFRDFARDPQWQREGVPSRSADGIGAAMAAAGVGVVEDAERVARQLDPALQATVSIGLPPEPGRQAGGTGVVAAENLQGEHGARPGRPGGQAQPRRDARGGGPRGG